MSDTRSTRVRRRLVLTAVATAVLAACSTTASTQRGLADVFADQPDEIVASLEQQGLQVTAEQVADAEISCPDDVDPAEGSVTTCTATIDGDAIDVTIEFTGDDRFDVTALRPRS